jgi:hypothetical protein
MKLINEVTTRTVTLEFENVTIPEWFFGERQQACKSLLDGIRVILDRTKK